MLFTYSKPQFGRATFKVLNSHIWFVATVLDSIVIEDGHWMGITM